MPSVLDKIREPHSVAALERAAEEGKGDSALPDLLSVLRAAKRQMDSDDDADYFDSTILLNEALSRFSFEDDEEAGS
jgi:hypothetical protein